ncbi:MAG: S8 family peptidase [Muribaculaceae bacterium]|nr:S8 family peptidase [Muribaculaceae bacterium]
MNKKFLLIPLLALAATGASAQLSLEDQALLRAMRFNNTTEVRKAPGLAQPSKHVTAIVKMSDGADSGIIEQTGATVTPVRGGFAVVSMPIDSVEATAALPCFDRFDLSRTRYAKMNMAREASGVSAIHAGTGLTQPYTGKGVITGIVDQGLDPNHINFVREDGKSRLGYLANIALADNKDGWYGREFDRDNIFRFQTDTHETFHGTHTLGILAGGYDKDGLQGVATGSDVAASCGDLVDALILMGIERILDYAAMTKQPTVISLSIGSNAGSHSPKAAMNQYLDEVSREAMVVISAGNEGNIPLAIKGTFTEENPTVRTFIKPTYQDNLRYGEVRIYSDRPFSQQALIYNSDRGTIRYRMPLTEGQEEGVGLYYADQDYSGSDLVSTQFGQAYQGYVGIGWSRDELTGEFFTILDYYTFDNPDTNPDGKLLLGFEITGEPGQKFECYCDGMFTELDGYGKEGWSDGGFDGTINDMACGYETLVVGSYNTRQSYTTIDGRDVDYSETFPLGKITSFTSWGTLADGRSLPHVCAPGAVIMSSCNRYYTPDENSAFDYFAKATDASGNEYLWTPAMGTSMATPYVAGSLALWLEADPTLTMDTVKDIIATTSTVDDEVRAGNPVQWGAGKFNAYAGLAEVIRRNSVSDISTDVSERLIVTRDGFVVTATLPAAKALSAKVLNTTGATVMTAGASGDTVTLDISALAPGVYILCVNDRQTVKIAI